MENIQDLRVVVLTRTDKADPFNLLATVGARGYVNGKQCAWRGDARWSIHPGETQEDTLARAIENLIKQMIAVPAQRLDQVPEIVED